MDGLVNALEQFTPLMAAFVSHINKGVVLTDHHGKILFHNPAAGRMLGVRDLDSVSQIREVTDVELQNPIARVPMGNGIRKNHYANGQRHFQHNVMRNGVKHVVDVNSSTVPIPGQPDPVHLLVMGDTIPGQELKTTSPSKLQLITQDQRMLEIGDMIEQIAPNKASVLIQGESGTGKSLIARMLHQKSSRADKPLLEINCAAIPEALLESEMFGHVKGAFTGASQDRAGRLQAADGGTLFLDEVSHIPLHLQPKLLKALEEQSFQMVGSDKTVNVDVRIIAASNADLRKLVDQGKFRADLYYRLAVLPVDIPALRERPGDIHLLARHICNGLLDGITCDLQCAPETLSLMLDYPWPGNVRELANAVEHAVILSENGCITPRSLPAHVREYQLTRNGHKSTDGSDIDPARKEILDALEQTQWNRGEAARLLGIDRSTLWRRMHRLNLIHDA